MKFHKLHQGYDSVEDYREFFPLAMRRGSPEALVSKYRAGLWDEIHDKLIGHKFLAMEELHRHALEVEKKLKRLLEAYNTTSCTITIDTIFILEVHMFQVWTNWPHGKFVSAMTKKKNPGRS